MAGLVRWKDALFLRVSRLRFDILPTEWYVRITLLHRVSRLIPVRLPASFRVRWLDFTAVPRWVFRSPRPWFVVLLLL